MIHEFHWENIILKNKIICYVKIKNLKKKKEKELVDEINKDFPGNVELDLYGLAGN